ncbi:MAG TPA: protein-tyrosine-phosphatase [Cytophagales bacterium]|nr:protein-tyrosine-phosphatase [Cytophagales bacterium]
MYLSILNFLQEAESLFKDIPDSRRVLLDKIGKYVASKSQAQEKAELIYICTHNSRRSHFGQIWAKIAARYYGFDNVETYSGGTEATAFNPNAIKAIKALGFLVGKEDETNNPRYTVMFDNEKETITCFSKKYDDAINPKEGFCAVMTCTEADGACPFIPGASLRVSTPYLDPKASDNTDQQDAQYAERSKQIAVETLYAFSVAKKLIS